MQSVMSDEHFDAMTRNLEVACSNLAPVKPFAEAAIS